MAAAGGGWPLSNGEGGGGDAAAEKAGLGCATRRCHHCIGANSGGGAGSYFPLLPRCCFCRLGRRRREGGGGRRRRAEPGPAQTPAGGGGSRAVRSSVQGGGPARPSPGSPPSWGPQFSVSSPPALSPLPHWLRVPGSSALALGAPGSPPPQLSLPSPAFPPSPGFPTPGSPSRGRPQSRRPVNEASKQKSGRFKRAFETR